MYHCIYIERLYCHFEMLNVLFMLMLYFLSFELTFHFIIVLFSVETQLYLIMISLGGENVTENSLGSYS